MFHQFLKEANFRFAWKEVAQKRGCAGVDGETIDRFAKNADCHLNALRGEIEEGQYYPLPLRQIIVPKREGGVRKLGVPAVRDRVAQQALLNILHPLLEPQFESCSFAYRPGRSHLMAVRKVCDWRDRGYTWVLDADIVGYFDNIQISRLLSEVREKLVGEMTRRSKLEAELEPVTFTRSFIEKVITLIKSWMTVGILTSQGIVMPEKGIPQGAVISPILANVYLDDLDEILTASGFQVVRYADDFVVLTRKEEDLLTARNLVAQLLSDRGLELHPDKTLVTTFKQGIRFLGHVITAELAIPTKKVKTVMPVPSQPTTELKVIYSDPPLQPTAMQMALVAALQNKREPIPPPLFVVLGYQVRQEETVRIESKELSWNIPMANLGVA